MRIKSKEWVADCMAAYGRVLTGDRSHWCYEWDGLPIDETCPEHASCSCKLCNDPNCELCKDADA